MPWFKKDKYTTLKPAVMRDRIPEGLWTKCSGCNAVLYRNELERNLEVCPKCGYHMRIDARRRLEAFLDWLHEISGSTLTSLGSGLFLAIQLLGDGWRDRPVWWWLVIVVATLLSISGLVVSLSLRPTRHELLTRVEQAHHRHQLVH